MFANLSFDVLYYKCHIVGQGIYDDLWWFMTIDDNS